MEEKLNRDAAVMGDSERKKLQNSIMKKTREAKRSDEELREDLNIRQNEILGRLQKQIFEAIRELAKEGGYDLLLTDGVLYASDVVNVTPLLQEKLRKSF
jgi:outer membrane protein